MPAFTLPPGYSFDPSEASLRANPSLLATTPGKPYGGADISQKWDWLGIHYVACNAEGPGPAPTFRWRTFKDPEGDGTFVEVPLPFISTGRGEMDVQEYDGKAWGIAWINNQFNFDVIPGFVPFPSLPQIWSEIQQLKLLVGQGGGGSGGPGWHIFPELVTSQVWEDRLVAGSFGVNIPAAFQVPAAATYLCRLVVQAPTADVRFRIGTAQNPVFFTVNTQAPNVQVHTQPVIPGPDVLVSVPNGATARVWLQLLGYL